MLAVITAAICLVAPQTVAPGCNDQARKKTTCAGNTSTGSTSCPGFSFTITIAGQSFTFTSPQNCDTGRREQDKDCYECGNPSTGNHCKTRQFQATVSIYSIGGGNPCPSFPDPLPSTLQGASGAISCKPLPLLNTEKNWCASDHPCGQSALLGKTQDTTTLVIGNGQGTREVWSGDVLSLSPTRSDRQPWLASLPRMDVDSLPGVLAGALSTVGPVDGAEVSGRLDVSFYDRGEPSIVNRYDFTAFLAEGRIHVKQAGLATDEAGQRISASESILHDGGSLLVEYEGSPVGHAYLPGYFDLPGVLRAKVAPYALLERWLTDPFGVMRLPGTAYATLRAENDEQVLETYPGIQGPGTDGSALYTLGGTQAIPQIKSVEHRSGSGVLRMRRTFDTYSEVAPGVERPLRVRETTFDEQGRMEMSLLLTLRAARALSIEEARGNAWLSPEANDWFVYQ